MMEFWTQYGKELLWIAGFFIASRVGIRFLAFRIVESANDGDPRTNTAREKRSRSLANILLSTGHVVVWIVVVLMVLKTVGVDTTPVLAASGVIAFGVGFGMQTIVRDFIAGILIFSENQFAEGDEVKIGGFEGIVEKMSMRTTVLRDTEGNLVFLVNGSISNVVNRSLKGHRLNHFGGDASPKEPSEGPAE